MGVDRAATGGLSVRNLWVRGLVVGFAAAAVALLLFVGISALIEAGG